MTGQVSLDRSSLQDRQLTWDFFSFLLSWRSLVSFLGSKSLLSRQHDDFMICALLLLVLNLMVAIVCESLINKEVIAPKEDEQSIQNVDMSNISVEGMTRDINVRKDLMLSSQEGMQETVLQVEKDLVLVQTGMEKALDEVRNEVLETRKEMRQAFHQILERVQSTTGNYPLT
jgi:hypothetical protein